VLVRAGGSAPREGLAAVVGTAQAAISPAAVTMAAIRGTRA